jgi:tRNA threonylcarbamoyladenosine biosynthesis protein TsaB
MLLLAADTSGKNGSIALAECDGSACQILGTGPIAGGTFSAQLVPQIADALQQRGFSKADLGGFAVVSGPGSFTGLRVGLAAIKALGEALRKPIAPVSLLELLAFRTAESMHPLSGKEIVGQRLMVMDAGRGELFAAEYDLNDLKRGAVGGEQLVGVDAVAIHVNRFGRSFPIVTPDPTAAAAIIARLNDPCLADISVVQRPQISEVARLGGRKIREGGTVSPEDLEANYIRRSDAEIFSKPNSG